MKKVIGYIFKLSCINDHNAEYEERFVEIVIADSMNEAIEHMETGGYIVEKAERILPQEKFAIRVLGNLE